jgi:hypothetical protein
MLFMTGLGLAVAIALVWQFTAKRDAEATFFVRRFIIACTGVMLLGLLLLGLYFLTVAHNLGGL